MTKIRTLKYQKRQALRHGDRELWEELRRQIKASYPETQRKSRLRRSTESSMDEMLSRIR